MVNAAVKQTVNYDYGDSFSYASWTENTVLTMTNVPWNSDYRDIVQFSNQAALDSWIDAQSGNEVVSKMSLLKFNRNVTINTPLNQAMRYNYARADNPLMPVRNDLHKKYYYFIQDYRYISPNATELTLQLDVWQTFGYQVRFGQCFVERGHIGIANSNAFNHYGRDYLTVPEGMDIGNEYRTVHVESTPIVTPSDPNAYSVLVCSTTELSVEGGTTSAPVLQSSFGSTFEGIPSGAGFYIFQNSADFTKYMALMSATPWMTEGIISVTVIPHITRYHPTWTPGSNIAPASIALGGSGAGVAGTSFYLPPITGPLPHAENNLTSWRDSAFVGAILGQYSILKKFLTYPYTVIELTTFSSSPVVLKPEVWQDANARVTEQACLVPPGQRIVCYPSNYNSDTEAADTNGTSFSNDDLGDFINTAVTLDNFPQMAVVNNMAIAFLANNKNGIAFAYSSADWSQQKALHGAQATFDVAGAEIGNRARQSGIANKLSTDQLQNRVNTQMQNNLNSLMAGSIEAGAGDGLPIVGMAGVMKDSFNALNNSNLDSLNTALGTTARGESTSSSVQAAREVRDTNVGLARFSAKGDYANAVAAENAKVQDAKMTQPSTSGQFGGDAFNLINGIYGYSLRFKMPNVNAIKTIGNFWLRYGYAIDQFIPMPTNLLVMSKFTYWKLSESYMTQAPIPEMFKQAIRGIFEKGVTVWANPGYIGNTALTDNAPLTGVSY